MYSRRKTFSGTELACVANRTRGGMSPSACMGEVLVQTGQCCASNIDSRGSHWLRGGVGMMLMFGLGPGWCRQGERLLPGPLPRHYWIQSTNTTRSGSWLARRELQELYQWLHRLVPRQDNECPVINLLES